VLKQFWVISVGDNFSFNIILIKKIVGELLIRQLFREVNLIKAKVNLADI
jgi:hypothetical protein